jgi:hypothetical protein
MASKRNEGLAALAALLMSSRGKGGNDPLSELLEGATFGGAIEIGPDGPRIIGPGELAEREGREDDDEPSGISNNGASIGRGLSTADLSDYVVQAPIRWQQIEQDGVLSYHGAVRFVSDRTDEPRDVHPVVLTRDEDDEQAWLLWSLCPNSARAIVTPLRGDEQKVLQMAGLMGDYFAGKLKSPDLSKLIVAGIDKARAARRSARLAKKQKH